MERLKNNPLDVESAERSEFELDDVDALIQQLEARFQGSHVLAQNEDPPTDGCTGAARCTGSCPCGPDEPEAPEQLEEEREYTGAAGCTGSCPC